MIPRAAQQSEAEGKQFIGSEEGEQLSRQVRTGTDVIEKDP